MGETDTTTPRVGAVSPVKKTAEDKTERDEGKYFSSDEKGALGHSPAGNAWRALRRHGKEPTPPTQPSMGL